MKLKGISYWAASLLLAGLLGLLIFWVSEPDHYEKMDELAEKISENPGEEAVRDLLNYPSDGAYSYYQMALIGAAFSHHPEVFDRMADGQLSERERFQFERLARLGSRVFEDYPELKPKEFDDQYARFDESLERFK